MIEYLKVIEEDKNFNSAKEKIEKNKPDLKQQAIARMNECATVNDFNTGFSNIHCSCNQQINGIIFDRKIYWKYGFYLTITQEQIYNNYANGNVIKIINSEQQSNLQCIVPPLAEQKRIADFLDGKCAEIDALVADIQSQIDTLEQYKRSVITETVTKGLNTDAEMKDSGIEWVGMIPNNWNTSKIKYIAEFAPHCDVVQLKPDFVVGYAPMECIKRGYFIERTAVYNSIPNSLTPFENGDIVMAKVTPCFENGNIAIMENLQSGIGFGSSELFVLRPKMINTKYLFYWLQNDGFIKKAASTMTGMGGLKRVSPQFVQDSFICIPTIAEQKRITEFLDTKCTEIDSIIDQKKEQLTVLENYKKSLIYEYVTGKKEVPVQ